MTQEIKALQDVILYEFQRSGKATMSFGEIWSVCTLAAPHLPGFFYEDTLAGRKWFVREIVRHLRHLGESYDLVGLNWSDNMKKIDRIAITPKGRRLLEIATFTNTERMGDRAIVGGAG